jgi:hypothetical protein
MLIVLPAYKNLHESHKFCEFQALAVLLFITVMVVNSRCHVFGHQMTACDSLASS